MLSTPEHIRICAALMTVLLVCLSAASGALAAGPTVREDAGAVLLANDHISVAIREGELREITDQTTGEVLLSWPAGSPPWYAEFGSRRVLPPKAAEVTCEALPDRAQVLLRYAVPEPDALEATIRLSLGSAPWVEASVQISSRAASEVELIGFPANARCAKGDGRYFVYPYNSGLMIPLGDGFGRMRVFNALPFVRAYPSNLCSMQWMGAYGRRGGAMIMSSDRYGSMKRLGALDAYKEVELVCESQASLPPGETFAPPPWRIVALPGGAYSEMASVYRDWVRERTAPSSVAVRDRVGDIDKVPLQFIPFEAKLAARPQLASVMKTHGYPEHAVRTSPTGEPFPYMPYGMTVALMRNFQAVYKGGVTPQMWSPLVESDSGWRNFPYRAFLEEPLTDGDTTFPGMTLADFLRNVDQGGDPVFLYVNPSFWQSETPDFRTDWMFDKDGDGVGDTFGGFEAGASGKPHYVSPLPVRDYLVNALRPLAALDGDASARAAGIMFDSSQVFGATLWGNSIIRRDPISCVDRNPNARYAERYGYIGRDSGVQDKLATYLALHEATSHAVKVGEWIGEFESLFLDVNAGSVDLKREFPDDFSRVGSDNAIPVPLFQMVYGDSQLFVVRVGAASDGNIGGPSPEKVIPAEVTRRGSAMFGAVHQALFWGGVRWAGEAFNRLHPRTWMIVRDNAARRRIFGKRASYRMVASDGEPTSPFFSVRETTWLDDSGAVVGVNWDNNSGGPASTKCRLGGRTLIVGNLEGRRDFVPGSLQRLHQGSTVTVMADGRFCLWNFEGSFHWDPQIVSVNDSAPTPEGLGIVWDGRYLSISNESPEPRSVSVFMPLTEMALAPVPDQPALEPDGSVSQTRPAIRYNTATRFSVGKDDRQVWAHVTLPGATAGPGDRPTMVPATLAAFEAVAEP